jgi:hypothetical protein
MLHMLAAMLAAGATGPQLARALDNLRPVLAPHGQDRLEPTGPGAAEAADALEAVLALLAEVAARREAVRTTRDAPGSRPASRRR